MEVFFDMSHSDTYGEAQGPWRDFRPDYVVGVTGSNGGPHQGVLPALDWKLLDVPDTDRSHYKLKGDYNSDKTVRVSKGVFRDYVPNGDYALRNEKILAAQQGADLPRRPAGFGFFQDPQLVFGAEVPCASASVLTTLTGPLPGWAGPPAEVTVPDAAKPLVGDRLKRRLGPLHLASAQFKNGGDS